MKTRKARSPVDRIMDGMVRCARARSETRYGATETRQRWAFYAAREERRFKRLVQRVLREARD